MEEPGALLDIEHGDGVERAPDKEHGIVALPRQKGKGAPNVSGEWRGTRLRRINEGNS